MDANTYKLVDGGWIISQGENGYTLTAQFYCKTLQTSWPKRGEQVPTTGSIAVPSGFSAYVISDVTVTPLTSVGPWIIEISATRKLGYNTTGSGSLTNERKVVVENTLWYLKRRQLASWPSRFPAGQKSWGYTLDYVWIDYYKSTGSTTDLDGPRSGIVTGIPAWCDLSSTYAKYRIETCTVEKVYDTNGETTLKHVHLGLLGLPAVLGTTWSTSHYPTISFSSI